MIAHPTNRNRGRRRIPRVVRTERREKKVTASPPPLISIIDDDESVRDSIQNLVRSAGMRAESFASAEDFLDARHLDDTDCIVLDIRMPGMNGLQLQQRLTDEGYSIPIIFVTAHPDEDVRRQALEAGASAYLRKPFETDALLQSMQSILKRTTRRRRDAT